MVAGLIMRIAPEETTPILYRLLRLHLAGLQASRHGYNAGAWPGALSYCFRGDVCF